MEGIGLTHQPCIQGADHEAEHRAKHHGPDRYICDGWPVRFDCLCLHNRPLADPELIQDTDYDDRQRAQDQDYFFHAIMPNDRRVAIDFRIASEQLIAPAVNESAGAEDKKQRDGESNAQRRFTARCDNIEEKSEHVHVV